MSTGTSWKMMDGNYQLRVLLFPAEEGGFTAYALDLPGCISEGETEEEATANIQEALWALVAAYEASGEPIPWQRRSANDIVPMPIQKHILTKRPNPPE